MFDVLVHNWAIVAIAFTTVMLIVVPALVILKYVRISLNIMRTTRPPLVRNPLDYDRLTGEYVHFPAYDGMRLTGMIIRADPRSPRKGMIIFAHEFCSDMHSCARYCRPLRDVGYDVFTFDFRGHGQSAADPAYTPRQWVTDRDLHDMRGAIAFVLEWLAQRGLPREVGLFGISRGACAAILAADETPEIRAIVADGAYSTDRTIEYFMKRWAYIFATVRVVYENHHPLFWRFLRWCMLVFARREFRCNFPSVRKVIRRLKPRPILFIHGEKDSFLPVEQSRQLYALAGQPKYLWIAPGAKHNQAAIRHPQRYAELTVRFFDQHLGRAEARLPPAPAQPSSVALSETVA
ncbi:MAG: alpha/beta fold hydrolase [Phycisphaerae bacterium]|jgi:pimeloyl-ACP methyl ester carboxylesterase|nr:alpha/beta fold hydrolase [Phycisphaerae bacterium]MCZ2401038.1 alpha/beta fold hydrolase [Phycisphaerae bacterium]NUQ50649.1 alpha/beta fold hydrolase [Phycisphaerae bacterium]